MTSIDSQTFQLPSSNRDLKLNAVMSKSLQFHCNEISTHKQAWQDSRDGLQAVQFIFNYRPDYNPSLWCFAHKALHSMSALSLWRVAEPCFPISQHFMEDMQVPKVPKLQDPAPTYHWKKQWQTTQCINFLTSTLALKIWKEYDQKGPWF